jgi:hypothetical protein
LLGLGSRHDGGDRRDQLHLVHIGHFVHLSFVAGHGMHPTLELYQTPSEVASDLVLVPQISLPRETYL